MAANTLAEGVELNYENIKRLCREQRPPVVTTRDVMDEFEISQAAAYNRLTNLEERDEMGSKKIGASGNVWWLTEKG